MTTGTITTIHTDEPRPGGSPHDQQDRSDLAHNSPAGLPAVALQAARSTLGGALSVAEHLPAQLDRQLATAARDAFTHGLDSAALGAGIAMLVAAMLSARFFRGIQVQPDADEPAALRPSALEAEARAG